jgi:hypothetical protein
VKPRQRHKHYPTKLPHTFGYQGRIIHGKHDIGTKAKSPTMVGHRPQSESISVFFSFQTFVRDLEE